MRRYMEDLVDEEVEARHATAVSLDHLLLRYNSELRGMSTTNPHPLEPSHPDKVDRHILRTRD